MTASMCTVSIVLASIAASCSGVAEQSEQDQSGQKQSEQGETTTALRTQAATKAPATGNVLVVIMDDVGLDAVGCYPGSNADARTPHMDRLATEGVRFNTVWAAPSCSPGRATIMTGRFGFRTGLGAVIRAKENDPGLLLEETCIAEALKVGHPDLQAAFLGKWHLSGVGHGRDHATLEGFDHFRGTHGNIGHESGPGAFFRYNEIRDGQTVEREEYATTAVTSDALAVIESYGDEPWLAMVSYHAAHEPLHAPPKALRTTELSGPPLKSRHAHFVAMVEAMDHEIGRLWTSLPAEVQAKTTIIIVADNGGASRQMLAEYRNGEPGQKGLTGKGALHESGIRVPMIVAGRGVSDPGRDCAHVVNTTDLFATTLELMHGTATEAPSDSVSFAPYLASKTAPAARNWIFAERFRKGQRGLSTNRLVIRGQRFKLNRDMTSGRDRLYDLKADPRESHNLLGEDGVGDPTQLGEAAAGAFKVLSTVLSGEFGNARARALKGFVDE